MSSLKNSYKSTVKSFKNISTNHIIFDLRPIEYFVDYLLNTIL